MEGATHLSLVYDTADDSVKKSFCPSSSMNHQVTSVGIELRTNTDKTDTTTLSWQSILQSLYTAFPSLTRLSLTCFFDSTGKHAVRISALAETLQQCPNLQELQLHGVGFLMEQPNVHNNRDPFESLKQEMKQHRHIVSIKLDEIYFVQQNRPDSWLYYSQLVLALSASPTLSNLSLSSTTEYFSRPILTLSALQSLLSHDQLKRLSVHHFNLWGAGSALACAQAIRCNTTLTNLALTACVFAAAEGDNDYASSLLSGLDKNRSIQHLDLTASMLALEVAGLSTALLENQSLESFTLTRTRMAFDPVLHGGRLCRILKSIASHPCLKELHLMDAKDIPFSKHNNGSEEPVCDASLAGLRAFLHVVRDVVSENSTIQKIVMLHPLVAERLIRVCLNCSTALRQIGISTGLNRAQYWDLTLETSSSQQWVEAVARIANNDGEESVLTSTIFQIVSSNPLICSNQSMK